MNENGNENEINKRLRAGKRYGRLEIYKCVYVCLLLRLLLLLILRFLFSSNKWKMPSYGRKKNRYLLHNEWNKHIDRARERTIIKMQSI